MLLKTRVDALYTQEKIACDMGKLAKTEEKKILQRKINKDKRRNRKLNSLSVNYPPPKGSGFSC